MAPKKQANAPSSASASGLAANTAAQRPTTPKKALASARSSASSNPIATVYNRYVDETPQRTKLIDAFMGFLMVVGVLQFLYCVLAGNYPFNAFLAGFSATVGQFVLAASLRMQTNPANKGEFASVSPERAFADFVFGSVVLHFFCVHFIN